MNSIRSELNSLVISEFRSRKSSSAGLFSIFANIFLAIGCAWLCEILAVLYPQATIFLRSIGVVFIGTRWRALGNMMHECAHGIFVEKARDNTFFGHLISTLDLSDFTDYVKQHVSHHAYLGNPERDLDYKSRRAFLNPKGAPVLRLFNNICMCATILPLWLHILRPSVWTKESPLWVNLIRTVYLASAFATLCIPATRELAALYLFLPYLAAYQWMKIFSDSADHLFLYGKDDPLDRSRNHLLPTQLLNWVFFPRNDAYHLLHHLFPSMPTHHYPKAHVLLLQHPWYSERSHQFVSWAASEPLKEAISGPK